MSWATPDKNQRAAEGLEVPSELAGDADMDLLLMASQRKKQEERTLPTNSLPRSTLLSTLRGSRNVLDKKHNQSHTISLGMPIAVVPEELPCVLILLQTFLFQSRRAIRQSIYNQEKQDQDVFLHVP
ncbi:hypothetical protein GUITHDRAFT_116388 [Guillardia theta CCMP2712]|uniref:Uncharacterized protein n=1 Tax=Guillardia theta (strain CCMP2712) TaxID=905079 RepID=L1IMV9_GUITC|nr:hypothetical protein GUITHDRAFT_116388 [Guillardia theta CCMP2712]EKX37427.1 hypothetical protein GUITHDRAFT_116388 [Guillardia theta CCMP2712]|eukprot:XP_005824407.1 hypothetical protein GUITHDRAFT_116388 [Guillardia theta CCMP2712]